MLKVSVAITTYNGEKYIEEQLQSLLSQKRKPDEVIINDDNSSDDTIEIVQNFISKNELTTWRINRNSENKGYVKNFIDCVRQTKGDIIFYCDQDDIWHEDKIIKMSDVIEQNESIQALCCSFTVIDSEGNESNSFLNRLRLGDGKLRKIDFITQVKNNQSVGITLAIRRNAFNKISPIIEKYNLPHDVPIGLFTSFEGGYYTLGLPLVYRRVHSSNTSSPKYTIRSRLINVDKHIEGRIMQIGLLESFLNEKQGEMNNDLKEKLINIIQYHKQSVKYLRSRNIMQLIIYLFKANPMINRALSIVNIICAVFGDYSKVI